MEFKFAFEHSGIPGSDSSPLLIFPSVSYFRPIYKEW